MEEDNKKKKKDSTLCFRVINLLSGRGFNATKARGLAFEATEGLITEDLWTSITKEAKESGNEIVIVNRPHADSLYATVNTPYEDIRYLEEEGEVMLKEDESDSRRYHFTRRSIQLE